MEDRIRTGTRVEANGMRGTVSGHTTIKGVELILVQLDAYLGREDMFVLDEVEVLQA